MAKRKRTDETKDTAAPLPKAAKSNNASRVTVQIVTGSYDRVLHGLTASFDLNDSPERTAAFAETFLFNAHASSVRCLAISPLSKSEKDEGKRVLASGGTDERINLYQLSTLPPAKSKAKPVRLGDNPIDENLYNRELGSLLHHDSAVSALHFPNRSKLLSASEDNTIGVIKARDWTLLSSIKAPTPKSHGRPSGDTASVGAFPAGVNDFAVHPSMKLMLSVGRGEPCLRLWNLLTGKKAGVLAFNKAILSGSGPGKWASLEGRKLRWSPNGEEFAVAFERAVVVFGMNSKPKARIVTKPLSKIHQIRYLDYGDGDAPSGSQVIAVSTEDGRIVFYSIPEPSSEDIDEAALPACTLIGQLGGQESDLAGRIKDFELLKTTGPKGNAVYIAVAAGSDGSIRVWDIQAAELAPPANTDKAVNGNGTEATSEKQLGRLLGLNSTGNRITCLAAFVMDAPVEA